MTLNRPAKSTDARDRLGVYKRFADVPERRRLRHHDAAYEGRDVWKEFVDGLPYESDGYYDKTRLAEVEWKGHMADRGRHHALATPDDVETYCAALVDRYSRKTAYQPYYLRVEHLYEWLATHTDHPHVYNPVLMAVAESPAAGEIWKHKMGEHTNR